MQRQMTKLAGFLSRHRRPVLVVWILIVLAAIPFAARQTENLVGGGFEVPGSGSQAVEQALSEDFGPAQSEGIAGLLRAEPDADRKQIAAGVDRFLHLIAERPELVVEPGERRRAIAALSARGAAVVELGSKVPASMLNDVAVEIREEVALGEAQQGVTPYLLGQPAAYAGLQELSQEDLEQAEVTGFPLIALVLLAVFGSLAAASLPLMLGFAAVIVTGALIWLLSQQMEMSVFVVNMASMIGIGVAVDYSLFILARYREELRAGRSPTDAREVAQSTSGLAVTFSGLAVVISLAGLWMVDNQALRSMALGAMVVVAVAVLVATTLLPVMIRMLGHRVEAGGITWSVLRALTHPLRRRRRRGSTRGEYKGFWERWTTAVMRRPVVSVVAASTFLLVLAIPVLSLKTGNSPLEQFPEGHDVREGAAIAQELTGGGANPIAVVAHFEEGDLADPANRGALNQFAAQLRGDRQVESIAPPVAGEDGAALLDVTPRSASESQAAQDLVGRMRESVPAALDARATVAVGGETGRIRDVRAQIDGSMWKIIAFVLAFSFVVLTLMLRSLVLPLKAILMNLLSIGAAYGVLVAVFQWGWLDGLLGFESLGALDTLSPPLILAVVFGLSMDYEVFLLSRIRERHRAHGDNRRAVAEGLASSARTISSAALIMTLVFGVFVLTGVPSIKELGLGNAVAIALDATIVRLILVPAAMQLLGDWNWWMPAWLDRLLPELGFETAPEPTPAEKSPAGATGAPARA